MPTVSIRKTDIIRSLNDEFRRTFRGGKVFVTAGVSLRQDLPEIIQRVRTFDEFTADNDPHGEHDFGAVKIGSDLLFWKIDCYDLDMQYGSPDASDPNVTARVLTLMLAEDY